MTLLFNNLLFIAFLVMPSISGVRWIRVDWRNISSGYSLVDIDWQRKKKQKKTIERSITSRDSAFFFRMSEPAAEVRKLVSCCYPTTSVYVLYQYYFYMFHGTLQVCHASIVNRLCSIITWLAAAFAWQV